MNENKQIDRNINILIQALFIPISLHEKNDKRIAKNENKEPQIVKPNLTIGIILILKQEILFFSI